MSKDSRVALIGINLNSINLKNGNLTKMNLLMVGQPLASE